MGIGFGNREYGAWLEAYEDTLRPGVTVVDLGCGAGADVQYMHSRGLWTVGMDVSLGRVREAVKRVPQAHFVVANLTSRLPFATDAFDVVTASLSLHYFDRDTTDVVLADIARILKPDGVLLCRVNVAREAGSSWGTGIEREPDFFEVGTGRFKRYFTVETLAGALATHFQTQHIELQHTETSAGGSKPTLVAQARLVS